MSKTWEQEKAYCAKRADALAEAMEKAIQALDANSFQAAYTEAARYMPKKRRAELYKRFLTVWNAREVS